MSNNFSLDLQQSYEIVPNVTSQMSRECGSSGPSGPGVGGINVSSFCWPTNGCPTNGCSSPSNRNSMIGVNRSGISPNVADCPY